MTVAHQALAYLMKDRSRANSDDEVCPVPPLPYLTYSLLIFLMSPRSPYPRYIPQGAPTTPLLSDTLPSAFSTQSKIAIYTLEREEARRHAEYEAKPSEMIWRVEHAARHAPTSSHHKLGEDVG
jgi:hypothetical protein